MKILKDGSLNWHFEEISIPPYDRKIMMLGQLECKNVYLLGFLDEEILNILPMSRPIRQNAGSKSLVVKDSIRIEKISYFTL